MERVVSLLGTGRIECLLADREFGNGNFQKWLQIRNIKYCVTLRENLYIRKDGEKKGRMLRGILSSVKVGGHIVLHDAYLTRKGVRVRIYATRRIGRKGEESLIILASPIEFDCSEKLYRRRWTLETAFRGLKTCGFNMEDTHLGKERFENVLTLVMIAYASAFIKGLIKIKSLPIPMIKKKEVQRISIFRYGYVELLHEFWGDVKNQAAFPT